MANYGVLYVFRFESTNKTNIEIQILQKDYRGTRKYRSLGRAPILKREKSGCVHGSSLELYAECQVDGEFASLYTSSADEYKVEVYKIDEFLGDTFQRRVWTGFVSPELYSEPDIAPPYDVQVIATDGLGELKNYVFEARGLHSVQDHLEYMLGHTGLSQEFNVVSFMAGDSGTVPIIDAVLSLDHMAGESCYDVLKAVLDSFHAEIACQDGYWMIWRETDLVDLASQVEVAEFGSKSKADWWSVGQLSTVIEPAKKRVTVISENAYKDNVLKDVPFHADGATYDSDEKAFVLSTADASVFKTMSFGAEVGYKLSLSVIARSVGSGDVGQSIGIKVKIEGRGYSAGDTFWLREKTDGKTAWSNAEGVIEKTLDAPSASDSAADAQTFVLELPLYYYSSRAYQYAEAIEVTVINMDGSYPVNVYDVTLSKAEQVKGYRSAVEIDNGAREEADEATLVIADDDRIPAAADIFMDGIALNAAGASISSWASGRFPAMGYLAFMSRDYALSSALPRMKVQGVLNVPESAVITPVLFLRDGTYYFPETYSYDLLNDELSVSLVSIPTAEINVVSEEVTEVVDPFPSRPASGSSSGGSSGGGGTSGGGSAGIEGSEFVEVKDGKVNLVVDPQGGLGATQQGLGIVDIPSAASQELKDYADTAAHTAYEQAYNDAVQAATSYAEKMPFKTINGQGVRGEGDITIVGAKGEKGEKGDKGDAGVTSAQVSVDNKAGLPSATASVVDQVLKIKFSGLKGEQGNSGFTGAADELEVVNNLTQGGAAAALSAEMGKQLNEVLYGKTESNEGEDEGGSEGADGEIVTLTSADFVQGTINSDGNFATSAIRIRTDKIAVKMGDTWQVIAEASQKWAYELYDESGKASYNSGWITSSRDIDIAADGFIGFVICKTNGGNIVPSELLTTIKDITASISLPKHITEDDITSDNYGNIAASGGKIRGRFLVDAADFIDYKISLSVAADSNMKAAIHLKNVLDWATNIYDSGWITAGKNKAVRKSDGADARYIAIAFLYTSSDSNQPSIEDIKKYITIDIAYDAGDNESGDATEPSEPMVDRGLVGKVDDLSSSVSEVEKNLKSMKEEIDELQQQVAEGVEIVNNLTDGGEDKALSAEMGKQVGEILYGTFDTNEYYLTSDDFVQGSINASGAFNENTARIRTEKIAAGVGDQWQITANGQKWFYYIYERSGSMVSGSGWLNTDGLIEITADGYIAFGVAFTNNADIIPTDLQVSLKCTSVVVIPGKKGLIENVANLLDHAEVVQEDIYGVPSEYQYTQDDFSASDYLTALGKRGYIQWPISEYPSWELAVNVPSASLIKCAIQGSAAASYGTMVDDSGWINPGKSKTYSSTRASGGVKYARLVFTDYATAETIPSVEDILANGITFSFKAVAQAGGLIVRMDALESKITMPAGSIVYQGEKVDLSEHGFTYKIIGSLATGVSSRQGSALWGKYFFQFHNTLENIVVYDLEAKKNVQTLTLAPNNNHHAGSGGFGNEFYDASDDFPLLYISSMYEMKVYVYRITGEVGAWSITLVQTITIGLDLLKIPNITIDRESNKIVFFGYTKNSWKEPSGNQSVITSCDIPLLSEGDVTISEFYNVSRLPFIYAQQGAFARFGKLYLSYGNTVSECGVFVIDYKGGVTLTSIDFTSMGNFEPEGFEKYGDKVIMTDQNGNIYELSF